MSAIHGMNGRILKQSGASATFSQQACTDSGDHKRYQITNAALRYWDPTANLTVEKSTNGGTSWSAVASGFSAEFLGGNIVFAAANGASDLVRVSGKNFAVADWGGFLNWKLDLNADLQDVTVFGSNGWKEFTPGLKDAAGSAEAYWQDGSNLALIGAGAMIFILYTDYGAAKRRYECYGHFKKDGVETPVDAIIKESIDFQLTGTPYYREG